MTIGLIGSQRKYAAFSEDTSACARPFGLVSSTLQSQSLDRISDKAWLAMVRNKSIPEDRFEMRRYKEGHWEESSTRMFSQNMVQVAKRFPDRFGRLAPTVSEQCAFKLHCSGIRPASGKPSHAIRPTMKRLVGHPPRWHLLSKC